MVVQLHDVAGDDKDIIPTCRSMRLPVILLVLYAGFVGILAKEVWHQGLWGFVVNPCD